MKKILLLALFSCLVRWSKGQDFTKPDPTIQTVTLDLVNYSIKDFGLVPFDDAIRFIGPLSDPPKDEKLKKQLKKDEEFYLYYKEGTCPYHIPNQPTKPDQGYVFGGTGRIPASNMFGDPTKLYLYFGEAVTEQRASKPITYFKFKHFEPNKSYCLQITQHPKYVDSNHESSVKITMRTASSFADRVKLDIGLAYVPDIKTTFGVVSGHIYFSPINDDADIKIILNDKHWFAKRFSVFACIAPFVVGSGASQEVKPLDNLGNYGFGFGWRSPFYGYSSLPNDTKLRQIGRQLQPLRINVGMMHYAQANPNPVITKTTGKWSPMISITYSFGIAALLGPLIKLFG